MPLAHQQRAAQVGRHVGECVIEAEQLVGVRRVRRGALSEQIQIGRGLHTRAAGRAEPARQAHVVRDLVEPGSLELGDDTLSERRAYPQERVLDGVLGLLARTQLADAVPQDLVVVLGVEPRGLFVRPAPTPAGFLRDL